jgi:hypothetical protein
MVKWNLMILFIVKTYESIWNIRENCCTVMQIQILWEYVEGNLVSQKRDFKQLTLEWKDDNPIECLTIFFYFNSNSVFF